MPETSRAEEKTMPERPPADGEEDIVLYRVEHGVAVITFNRPDRLNAWIPELERQYVRRLRLAAESDEVRVIVVTGSGEAFCAGADTKLLGDIAAEGRADGPPGLLSRRRLSMHEFEVAVPKPVIAAVHGPCIGIGLSHALLCDLRFASPTSRWGATFARLGLVAEQASAWSLKRLIGPSRAADLLFSGRLVDGEEAYRMGLADRLADDARAAALDYAAGIAAACSPASLAAIKGQLRRADTQDLAAAADEADRLGREALAGQDFREGVRAMRERRPAAFAPLAADSYPGVDLPR
jgi:enoyl-CoA hydratase/carnithine racemase